MYYSMAGPGAEGWLYPLINYAWTQVQNIKRDPFEQSIGSDVKSAMNVGGAIAAPMTAYQYDWNMLPIGQLIALRHLETFEEFPQKEKRL